MEKARLILIFGGVICAGLSLLENNINWYKVALFGYITLDTIIDQLEENK